MIKQVIDYRLRRCSVMQAILLYMAKNTVLSIIRWTVEEIYKQKKSKLLAHFSWCSICIHALHYLVSFLRILLLLLEACVSVDANCHTPVQGVR